LNIQKVQIDKRLKGYIKNCMLICSNNYSKNIPQTFGYPEATPELVIILNGYLDLYYKDRSYRIQESCFFTFIDTPSIIIPSESICLIRVVFNSLGVFPIVKVSKLSASEITYSSFLLAKDIIGSTIRNLESKLYETKEIIEISRLMSSYLCNRLLKPESNRVEAALMQMEKITIFNVEELCDFLNCTPRTLQRWFQQNLNVPPKFYLRLRRFKKLLEELSLDDHSDYIGLAFKCGYSDQSHMIKEFKNFTSYTPSQFTFENYLPSQLGQCRVFNIT